MGLGLKTREKAGKSSDVVGMKQAASQLGGPYICHGEGIRITEKLLAQTHDAILK